MIRFFRRKMRRKVYVLFYIFLFFLLVLLYPIFSKAASVQAQDGTFYASLVDISGSMPEDAFVSGRSGIRELAHRVGPQDEMSVITFGDTVTEIASFNGGDLAVIDNALSVLDTISPHDQTTKFYEALGFLQQRASAASQPIKRAVIMTDGVDVSDMTLETASALMSGFYDNNIRIYGVLVESGQSTPETTAQFKNFCEKTGGTIEIVNGNDAYSAFQSIISKMTSANVVIEEQERFQDAYQETGEVVPIEQWTAGIVDVPSSISSSESSSAESSFSVKIGVEGDEDGNGILNEYERGSAGAATKPDALELIRPHLPLIAGMIIVVAVAVVLLLIFSRRRPVLEDSFVTNGAGKSEKSEKSSSKNEKDDAATKEDDSSTKKEKEKQEKHNDKVLLFFVEKKKTDIQ